MPTLGSEVRRSLFGAPRARLLLALLVLALPGLLAGCGSDGSPTVPDGDMPGQQPPPDPDPEPDPPGNDPPRFEGFDLDLAVGDFWEFYWFSEELTVSSGSTSSSTDGGSFRLTLVDRVTVAGQTAFRVQATGENLDGAPLPRWGYLAADGSVLLGSTTGDSLQVILDAQTGSWSGGGFFAEFDPGTQVQASEAQLDNEYVTTDVALAVGGRSGQDFCQVIAGRLICTNDEAYSLELSDYFKAGIGPLGLVAQARVADQGGGVFTTFESRLEVGLVATSRRAPDGFLPSLPAWRSRADMPRPVADAATVSFGGLIYLFGGRDPNTGQPLRTSLVYDPAADSWAEGPDMAYHVSGDAFVLGDAIYFPTSDFSDGILSFQVAGGVGEWVVSAPYPAGISGSSRVGVIDDRLLFVQSGNVRPRYLGLYDPDTDTWETGSNRSQPSLATTGTAHTSDGARLYTSGGFSSGTFRSDLRAYAVEPPLADGMAWPEAVGSLEEGRARHRMAVLDGLVFVLGGDNFGPVIRGVEAWDPDTGTRVEASSMLQARQSFSTAVFDGRLYVFGGQSGEYLVSVEEYDPARDRRLP